MTLAFILTMPGNNAWNGKWTGEGHCYAVVRSFSNTRADQIAQRSYGYNFGDGWFARVTVKAVDATEARKLRKASQGFCGYEWMIDSIIADGAIYGPTQPKPVAESTEPKQNERVL
jgi:hypothetical protein